MCICDHVKNIPNSTLLKINGNNQNKFTCYNHDNKNVLLSQSMQGIFKKLQKLCNQTKVFLEIN